MHEHKGGAFLGGAFEGQGRMRKHRSKSRGGRSKSRSMSVHRSKSRGGRSKTRSRSRSHGRGVSGGRLRSRSKSMRKLMHGGRRRSKSKHVKFGGRAKSRKGNKAGMQAIMYYNKLKREYIATHGKLPPKGTKLHELERMV